MIALPFRALVAAACLLVGLSVLPLCAQEAPAPPTHPADTRERLKALRVSFVFEDAEWTDLFEHLRTVTGLNVVVDPRVADLDSPGRSRVSVRLEDVPFRTAMKLVFEAHGLAVDVSDGVLYIVPRRLQQAQVELRVHDIRDLLVRVRDFEGPKLLIDHRPPDFTRLFTTVTERPQALGEDSRRILDLVRRFCGGDTWDAVPGVSLDVTRTGFLTVVQSATVQEEIAMFLNELRRGR